MIFTIFLIPVTAGSVERVTEVVRVVAQSEPVLKINERSQESVTSFGVTLENGDEVITEESGRATILPSMLDDSDEIYLLPLSRIRFIEEVTHENRTIFRIHLMYGKLKARSMMSRSKQVHIDTELVDAISNEGEFIIESNRQGTTIGTTAGMVRVVIKATNEEIQLHQFSMITISRFSSSHEVKNLNSAFLKDVF